MPTIYPTRTDKEQETQDVCECGHAWFFHPILEGQKCEKCLCPEYVFEQKLTYRQINELQDKLRAKNEKENFIQ